VILINIFRKYDKQLFREHDNQSNRVIFANAVFLLLISQSNRNAIFAHVTVYRLKIIYLFFIFPFSRSRFCQTDKWKSTLKTNCFFFRRINHRLHSKHTCTTYASNIISILLLTM